MVGNRFSLGSWIAKQKFIRKQLIHKPSFFSPESYVDSWTPYYWTSNEITQTLSRLMAWDDEKKRWLLARCDQNGMLLVSSVMKDRQSETIRIFADITTPATSILTHDGIDVSAYSKITLLLSTTGSCNVYPQFSNDNVNWYDWYDLNDVTINFSCNNVKKAWEIDLTTKYIRIIIYNTTSSSVTVTGVLMCQV